MRRDWSTTRRVWITAVVLAALVIGGGGGIWLLRGFAVRATYRVEPGKLTLGIEAEVVPTYKGIELPPDRYMIDDVPPPMMSPVGNPAHRCLGQRQLGTRPSRGPIRGRGTDKEPGVVFLTVAILSPNDEPKTPLQSAHLEVKRKGPPTLRVYP